MFTDSARQTFLSYAIRPADDPILRALEEAVMAAPDALPSQTAAPFLEWIFTDGFIPECCRTDLLWTLDAMQDWMFLHDAGSTTQRRSRHPRERARRIRCVVNNFVHDPLNECPLESILTDPDMRYERREDLSAGRAPLAVNYRLAAAIDRGEAHIISLVEECIAGLSDRQVVLLAQDWRLEVVIRAALRSRNAALHEAVARRAASVDGYWQAKWLGWCDLGRREAMIAVLRGLEASDLFADKGMLGREAVPEAIEQLTKLYCARFSSPIPPNQHHLLNRHGNGATMKGVAHIRDYITPDTVRTALRCLTEPDFRDACLNSDEGVRVHLALWAMGAESDQSALAMADTLIETGAPVQRLAACLFVQQGCLTWADSRYTPGQDMGRWLNRAIRLHPEEKELLAVCMPPALVRTEDAEALLWWFVDENEARDAFDTYMTLTRTLEKKETFEGCGYPWLKVHLLRSDAARNACTLAGLLRDDDLIDRACGILKQVSSDDRYGMTMFLCRGPRTDAQRQAFFGLMCDRDPGMRAIHRRRVTAIYQPTPADAPALEALLTTKYDDARAEALRLLTLLPEDALQESAARLCASRRETLRAVGERLCARISPR